MFFKCNSFEEFRAAAYKVVVEDNDNFELLFINGPDGPGGIMERKGIPDGTWPDIEDYEENDFNEVPDEYPVIAFGSLNEEWDRYGAVKIFLWEWVLAESLD